MDKPDKLPKYIMNVGYKWSQEMSSDLNKNFLRKKIKMKKK